MKHMARDHRVYLFTWNITSKVTAARKSFPPKACSFLMRLVFNE